MLPATPGSARSNGSSSGGSIADLEDTIVQVLGVRMQSMVDLRQRVDQLGELYRREEDTFRHQMRQVLELSEDVRVSNESREVELERALAKERADRVKVLELMSQFKKEGAAVIHVMKESLRDATAKWKAELERNAKLTAQLRRAGGLDGQGGSAGNAQRSQSSASSSRWLVDSNGAETTQASAMQTRIEALTQLVQEEDSVIVALRSRNRALEQRVAVLTQQRDKLLEVDGGQSLIEESFQGELRDLPQVVRRCDAALLKEGGAGANNVFPPTPKVCRLLADKCEALERYTRLLLQRLSIEQRQRLRVEEQSARIASAQDQLVQSLETRIKDLDRSAGGSGTPKHAALLAGTAGELQKFRRTGSSPGSLGASRGTRLLPRAASGGSVQRSDAAGSDDDEIDTQMIPDDEAPCRDRPAGDGGADPCAPPGTDEDRRNHGGRGGQLRIGEELLPSGLSLEAQLAMVTQEFHASVEEWSQETSKQRGGRGRSEGDVNADDL